jgi:hypothetical protein
VCHGPATLRAPAGLARSTKGESPRGRERASAGVCAARRRSRPKEGQNATKALHNAYVRCSTLVRSRVDCWDGACQYRRQRIFARPSAPLGPRIARSAASQPRDSLLHHAAATPKARSSPLRWLIFLPKQQIPAIKLAFWAELSIGGPGHRWHDSCSGCKPRSVPYRARNSPAHTHTRHAQTDRCGLNGNAGCSTVSRGRWIHGKNRSLATRRRTTHRTCRPRFGVPACHALVSRRQAVPAGAGAVVISFM